MISKYYGISKLSNDCQRLVKDYSFFYFFSAFAKFFTLAFIILHLIFLFGPLEGGLLLSVYFFVNTSFDFLTGVISDKIGQKYVLIFSFISYASFFILFSIFNDVLSFSLIMIIYGLGSAFESGALQTWFSNNYKILSENDDRERKIYGYISARLRMFYWFFVAISVFLGGQIVYYFSDLIAFRITGLLYITLFITVFFYFKERYYSKNVVQSVIVKNNVQSIFFHSIAYVFKNKVLLLFVIGYLLWFGSFVYPFLNLILFPIYYGYSGNAQVFGVLESITFIIGVIANYFVSILSKKMKNSYISIIAGMYNLSLQSGLVLLLVFIPLKNEFNLFAIVLIIIITFFSESLFGEAGVNLNQRIILDLIPSEFRNSILSIMSTLLSFLTIILLLIVGLILERNQMIYAIVFLELVGLVGALFYSFSFLYERKMELSKI